MTRNSGVQCWLSCMDPWCLIQMDAVVPSAILSDFKFCQEARAWSCSHDGMSSRMRASLPAECIQGMTCPSWSGLQSFLLGLIATMCVSWRSESWLDSSCTVALEPDRLTSTPDCKTIAVLAGQQQLILRIAPLLSCLRGLSLTSPHS